MSMELPENWIPWNEGKAFLESHMLINGSHFILENWKCKYIDARIDMRTGEILLKPGNHPKETK